MELLDANADPKLPIQSGACPLYIAAMKGQVDVCRILLDCGRADPNQTPGHGTTALLISVRNGHEKALRAIAGSFRKQEIIIIHCKISKLKKE